MQARSPFEKLYLYNGGIGRFALFSILPWNNHYGDKTSRIDWISTCVRACMRCTPEPWFVVRGIEAAVGGLPVVVNIYMQKSLWQIDGE